MRRIGIEVVGPDESETEVSLERLPEIDADWLVVPVGGGSKSQDVYDEISKSEIFQRIPAVAAGRVITVDGTLWPGLGYLWAVAMVEDLDRLFGGGSPSASASPSPQPTS
jgi:ABC-type Fe3+-hydroxamate transport system substrate-binding protein